MTVPSYPVIVVTHSFDRDVQVYEYDPEDDMQKKLEKLYGIYLQEERNNNSPLIEEETFCDEGYARITWEDESRTEFSVTYSMKEV